MIRKPSRLLSSKKWIVAASLLALIAVVIGRQFDLFSLAADYYATATHKNRNTKPEISPNALTPKLSVEEQQRQEALKAHTDSKERIVFAPTAVAEMKIDPELVKGIPWEANYEPLPLNQVKVTYTEDQFQKDRADWYQNLFITEYEQNGHRDPKWDNLVSEFLKEAAWRVSITRYKKHRSSKFYSDQFDDHFAEDGKKIVDLGCKDPLVYALFVEELARKNKKETRLYANQLVKLYDATRNSEIINYQIVRMLLYSSQAIQLREKMTHHYRKAINKKQLTSLERRIYFEEVGMILAPAHSSILAQFIVSLENQAEADPWLKNMILGGFYNEMAMNGNTLNQFWPSYNTVYNTNLANAKSVHMGHLRKAYRLYLQAYQIAPGLPEAPLKLFRMSFRQDPRATEFGLTIEEGEFDRLSPASPRYWFDQAIAVQFDYRPFYREYRNALIPKQTGEKSWSLYDRLLDFGLECLSTKRFETQVPFGFHDALQAIIRHDEYSIPPNSPRNQEVYALKKMLDPFKRMVEGYSTHFSEEKRNYYETLVAGMNWIQGHKSIAKGQFLSLKSKLDQTAIQELFLDVMELKRSSGGRTADVEMTVDLDEVKGLALLPNRPHLLFPLSTGRIRTWNFETHKTIKEYSLMPESTDKQIVFNISGEIKFISCYQEPILKIFETNSFTEVASLSFPKPLKKHRVSNTGRYVVAAVEERVEIWEVLTKKKIAEIDIRAEDTMWFKHDWRSFIQHVRLINFSVDDSLVAFVRGGIFNKFPQSIDWSPENAPNLVDRLYVWDIQKNKLIYENQPFFPNINSIGFTDAGEQLLVSGTDWCLLQVSPNQAPEIKETHSIKLMDPREAKITREYAGRNQALWVPTEYGQDNSLLVAIEKNELLVWDAETGKEITSLISHPQNVRFLDFSKQKNQIITIDAKGDLKIYSDQLIPNLRPVLTEPDFYENQAPHKIKFHSETKRMAVCNSNTGGLIWDFSDPQHTIGRAFRTSGPVGTTALDFSPDLKFLATTADSMPGDVIRKLQEKAPVSIWDTTKGEVVRVLEGETSFVESGTFDPTGRYFASGLRDGNIIIWDLQSKSNQPMQILKDHVAAVTELKFSPDGKFLISGGQRGELFGKKLMPAIKIWSATGKTPEYNLTRTLELNRRSPHPFGVQDIDLSADGKWILASYGVETSLFSFDGSLRCSVQGTQARFLPDGSKFITAGGVQLNKIVAMWDFDGQKIKEFSSGNRRPISALTLFPGKAVFLSASYSEGIAGWQSESGERVVFLADLFR
ncbi:MAG: hypothetical protein K0U86_01405 [Planctomycetes bacterium]|nr:hypothetical protein [Planctomycetota bacterium]MCH9775334.1 hypothetical protein [Planctomycetota bacterium]MCH9792701.1 hypothetical protein [Planctomycetota bacterium]